MWAQGDTPWVQLCDFAKCLKHKEEFQSYLEVDDDMSLSLKRSHSSSIDSREERSSIEDFGSFENNHREKKKIQAEIFLSSDEDSRSSSSILEYDVVSDEEYLSSDEEDGDLEKRLNKIQREKVVLREKLIRLEKFLQNILAELQSEYTSVDKRLLNARRKLEKIIGKKVPFKDLNKNLANDEAGGSRSTRIRSHKVLTSVKQKIVTALSDSRGEISDNEEMRDADEDYTVNGRRKRKRLLSDESSEDSSEDSSEADSNEEVKPNNFRSGSKKSSKSSNQVKSKKKVRELTDYEKMLQRNQESKMALLKSLGIDTLKEEIKESYQKTKVKREKKIQHYGPIKRSKRATKANCNFSEDFIIKNAMRTAEREASKIEAVKVRRREEDAKILKIPNAFELFRLEYMKTHPESKEKTVFFRRKWRTMPDYQKKRYFMEHVYLLEVYGDYDLQKMRQKGLSKTALAEAEDNIASCASKLHRNAPEEKKKEPKKMKPKSKVDFFTALFQAGSDLRGRHTGPKSIALLFEIFCKEKYKKRHIQAQRHIPILPAGVNKSANRPVLPAGNNRSACVKLTPVGSNVTPAFQGGPLLCTTLNSKMVILVPTTNSHCGPSTTLSLSVFKPVNSSKDSVPGSVTVSNEKTGSSSDSGLQAETVPIAKTEVEGASETLPTVETEDASALELKAVPIENAEAAGDCMSEAAPTINAEDATDPDLKTVPIENSEADSASTSKLETVGTIRSVKPVVKSVEVR